MSLSSNDFADAFEAIKAAKTIALGCHVNPDGDALGSMLGLGLALMAQYPEKTISLLSYDGVPDIYGFLPGSEKITVSSPFPVYDLGIALDSGDVTRTGETIYPVLAGSKVRIDIDHHVGDVAFGDVRLVDSKAAATAEIVYDLITYLDIPITTDIATCLLTGVITDTGSFRFMNVTPRTLRTAASLIEAGATPSLIAERVFDNRTFAATRLLGLCLSSLKSEMSGKITFASAKNSDFLQTGATDQDTEGFIALIRSIRGAEVALLFREFELGTVRISLRSSERVNVAEIAAQFDGGGHKMASGCTFHGTLAEAETALMSAVTAAIGK